MKENEEHEMADITVADIKALRDATGAGMMDAKRALEDSGGDPDEAGCKEGEYQLTTGWISEDRRANLNAVNEEDADQDRSYRTAGDAKRQQRNHAWSRHRIICRFRCGNPFNDTRTPLLGLFRSALFFAVGNKTRNRRTEPRHHADNRPNHR